VLTAYSAWVSRVGVLGAHQRASLSRGGAS
jgi:hypothetical protein